nr:RNA-directed DNA polymerase, eukaryota, reverse transcriptase zinc-binding domain protein [Tanacetum cinerariifolium]
MFKKPPAPKAARLTMMTSEQGRNLYARALIEVLALTPLMESVVVVVPYLDGSGHSFETVEIKEVVNQVVNDDDGFTKVTRKHGKEPDLKNFKKQKPAGSEGASTPKELVFQPYHISDHSPAVLRLPMNSEKKPRPFKFYNLLVHNNRFKEVVANGWSNSISRFWMFKVVKRLK